jgi:hypothetical protein
MKDKVPCPPEGGRVTTMPWPAGGMARSRAHVAVTVLLLTSTGCVTGAGLGKRPEEADALDRVTGTEGWRSRPESVSAEWRDWYRARVTWRREHREQRIQRVRSHRIGRLLEKYPDGPRLEEVVQVLQSRSLRMPAGSGAGPAPAPAQPALPLDGSEGPEEVGVEAGSKEHGKEPPAWVKVPVEKLDASGQAIDEEGDRELDRVFKPKKPKRRPR